MPHWFLSISPNTLPQVTLRARDCLQLIDLGREWYGGGKPCSGVPALVGHVSCSLRLVAVYEEKPRQLQVLTLKERVGRSGLPACLMGQGSAGSTEAVQRTLKVRTSSEKSCVLVHVLRVLS